MCLLRRVRLVDYDEEAVREDDLVRWHWHACCWDGTWELLWNTEHPSKEADVSGNATRYLEQQRLFPRRACLHKSVITYTTRTRSTLKIVYTTVVRSVWIFRNDGHTPETTLWYTIKPRAFRRDYIRKQIEKCIVVIAFWKYMEDGNCSRCVMAEKLAEHV